MNLSERIRWNSEAAPWVCEAVIKLESERDRLQDAVKEAYFEGFRAGGRRSTFSIIKGWENSDAYAELKEVEDDA